MFSFQLSKKFVEKYTDRPVSWGFKDAAGNSLGEITFLRTYSRKKADGRKETWVDVCERVINGMYSIQKDHARSSRLPWSDVKAHRSAEEAFDRMFSFKWLPPGRGLWSMGTPLVMEQRNSAALQNCAFVSTGDMSRGEPSAPFTFLMEASMLGVGVGFDLLGAQKGFVIYEPTGREETYVIPDTREGWVESTGKLIDSYLRPGQAAVKMDYGQIRPAGTPIRTFGGVAAGPEPLSRLHDHIVRIFSGRAGEELTSTDILDIANLIGVCVVSGNVRRSAELALGSVEDVAFLEAKNPAVYPERNSYDPDNPGWAWASNNSVVAHVGDDLSAIAEGIARNGEPGVVWLDVSRAYGRLADAPDWKDHRVAGFNPCAEQSLESYEMCTLVETFLGRHDSLEDYQRTLKFAYLYAKTVTLLPTHWERTNAIMIRNRRIGTSVSGVANFADNHGLPTLRRWLDEGYATVKEYDRIYSEWLGVRESVKTTTVKPSGTVSILAGESPGVHWAPGGEYFLRRIRFAKDDPMVAQFAMAGYSVEPASEAPGDTVVITFPVKSSARRSEAEVTLFEKASLAALLQRHWSDNGVSVTLSFDAETEGQHVASILAMYEGQLKTVSFLPMGGKSYPQMPFSSSTEETYREAEMSLLRVDLSPVYDGDALDAAGEAGCTTDSCEVKTLAN